MKIKRALSSILCAAMAVNMFTFIPSVFMKKNINIVFAEESKIAVFEHDGCTIEYEKVNSWIDSETTRRQQIGVTLINTGNMPITDWKLFYDFGGDIDNI